MHFYVLDVKACPACCAPADTTPLDRFLPTRYPGIPGDRVVLLPREVLAEMNRLGISEDIFDEVMHVIAGIQPDQRIAYLQTMFAEPVDRDGGF